MVYIVNSTARTASAMTGAYDLLSEIKFKLVGWSQARSTRAALLKLSDHELNDIGLNRADIEMIAAQSRA